MKLNEPLGLPQGSVRAIIALILVTALILGIMFRMEVEPLTGIASMIVGYYFGARKLENINNPREDSEVLASPSDYEPEEDDEMEIISGS